MRIAPTLFLLAATPCLAATTLPVPAPLPPAIPAPIDRPFPGQIGLTVDATDLNQHIIRVEETIPVVPGQKLILLFPKWRPGNHGPTGPLADLAGLMMTADGKPVSWVRDTVDMGAFHVDVPDGANRCNRAIRFPVLAER